MDNQHWIVNYRVECIGVARRYIHVSFSPCRRRHQVGKEYRAKKGRELRTEPYSIPAVRGQTEEERSTQNQAKKSWNECCLDVKRRNGLKDRKYNRGVNSESYGVSVEASNSIPPLAKHTSQGNRQAN